MSKHQRVLEKSSFRDSAGYIFYQDGDPFRCVSNDYKEEYQHLIQSGLYDELVEKGLLIEHEECKDFLDQDSSGFVIKPKKIPFISYPYEWSFSQLKDAALLTLEVQKIALKYGMQLKDASAYNVQFIGTKPVLIDTLSFERCDSKVMWKAYRQFCQHFLAPLALCVYCDPRLIGMLANHLDGIPLALATKLLPKKAFFSSLFLHLKLHGYFCDKRRSNSDALSKYSSRSSSNSARGLVNSLFNSVVSLKMQTKLTEWVNYYDGDSYEKNAFEDKKEILKGWLAQSQSSILWDLGSNDGYFTKIAAEYSSYCVAFDIDYQCIDNLYQTLSKEDSCRILPLHVDLANPSPGIGWANVERKPLFQRGVCDLAIALALVHHLIVSASIPLSMLVDFLAEVCQQLIIEYVPFNDPKFVQIASSNPKDFSYFTEDYFLQAFQRRFKLFKKHQILGSNRVLFFFKHS